MTRGLSTAEEMVALQSLRTFLLKHYARIGLEDSSISSSLIFVLDAEAEKVIWERVPSGQHMITCPTDFHRSKLAMVLRQVALTVIRPGVRRSPVGGSYSEVVEKL